MRTDVNQYEGYIKTISGKKFYLESDDLDELDIKDVAHALANQARFCGHTIRHYSVGEHSLLVLNLMRSWGCKDFKTLMTALMHDATEAYLPDFPTPFKAHMPEFQVLEERLWKRVAAKWDLWERPEDVPHQDIAEVVMGRVTAENLQRSLIKHADRTALFIEAAELQPHGDSENWPEHDFYGMLARGWDQMKPKRRIEQRVCGPFHPRIAFMRQFNVLSAGRELTGV